MSGSFDYLSEAAFGTIENNFGLSITFLSDSGAFSPTPAFGMVDMSPVIIDEFNTRTVSESPTVTVDRSLVPSDLSIGDLIRLDETAGAPVKRIIDVSPDVNTSVVYTLSSEDVVI